jgi:DNA-binding beta-propeller fold protein YncE
VSAVLKISLTASAMLLLQACAAAPQVMHYFPGGEAPRDAVVWPAPPEIARLEYSGVLIGDSNFAEADGSRNGPGSRLWRWITGLGGRQPEIRHLIRPQSGTVDATGRIFVTDAGQQAVLVFDERGAGLSIWRDAGRTITFRSPVGISSLGNTDILVADADIGSVIVLAADGSPKGTIGQGILQRPTGLSVDPSTGEIYVSDTAAHDIKVFSATGELLRTLGKPGTAPGEFNGPTHTRFHKGYLYVTDTLNARIQVIAANGQAIREIGSRGLYVGNFVRPKGVTTDSDGNVYVVESYYDHLLIFNAAGRLLLPIGGTGSDVGRFFLPAGVWSDDGDRIFIADMFNGRVIVLRYLGG